MKPLTRTIRCLSLSSCLALSGALSMAMAADLPVEEEISAEQAVPSAYTGSFTIYGFLPTFDGHFGINGSDPVNLGISQGELLDILNFAVMITGDIRRDKIGLFADLIYLDVSDTAATPGPLFSSARIELDATLLTIAATYQLYETEKGWLQGVAGAYDGGHSIPVLTSDPVFCREFRPMVISILSIRLSACVPMWM